VSGPLRILLVDSNVDDRLLVVRWLRKRLDAQGSSDPSEQARAGVRQVQVQPVDSEATLALALAGDSFDAVVTEYRLPWADGFQVLREVKQRCPSCPVVMFTASGNEELVVEALEAGFDGYVVKATGNYAKLTERVQSLLNRETLLLDPNGAEARYRELFERIPLALYRTLPTGAVADANPALVRLLRYPDKASLLNTRTSDLYENERDREFELTLLQREDVVRGFEMQLRRMDGTTVWVKDTCRAIRGEGGEVIWYEGSLEDISQHKRSEEEAQRLFEAEQERRKLAETLHQSSLLLSSTLELDEVLSLILEQLRRVLPYESASVQRLRDDHLEIVACQGYDAAGGVEGMVFPLDRRFPNYRVVASRMPISIDDVVRDFPRFDKEANGSAGGRIRSWLGVPLMVHEEPMGLIAISRAEVQPYSAAELQLAMTFANQAATAVHNARLFEELAARRRYLEAVLGSVPDAVVTLDPQSQIVEWNPGAEKVFGYTMAEALGKNLDKLITNRMSRAEAEHLTQTVMGGQDILPLERVRYRKDGSPVHVIAAGSPIIVGEQLMGVVAAYTDITQLQRAEEALRASEETYRMLVETSPDAVWSTDLQGSIKFVSQRTLELFGYDDAEELLGHDNALLVAQQDRSVALRSFVKALGDGLVRNRPLQLVRKDGEPFYSEVSGAQITDSQGSPSAYILTARDITERRKANEALRSSLEQTARGQRLLLALSHAAQAVQRAHTPEAVYRTIGDEIARLGYRASILTLSADRTQLALNYTTLSSAPLRAAERLTGLSARGYSFPVHSGGVYEQVIDKQKTLFIDGTTRLLPELVPGLARWLAGRLASMLGLTRAIYAPLILDGRVQGIMVVGGDDLTEAEVPAITAFANQATIAIENARLLDAVSKHRRDLQQLSSQLVVAQEDERKRIAQELHDELGQALTAIRINLAALEHDLPTDKSSTTRDRVEEALAMADSMLNQIRALALELRPSLLDDLGLGPTLKWYVGSFAKRLGIDVELDVQGLEKRLPPDVEIALYRLVQEALTNVARHAQASRVVVHMTRKNDLVETYVEDDGQGFESGDRAAEDVWSSGAGLLGMRERVSALGGSLSIRSNVGDGTKLYIEIPLGMP